MENSILASGETAVTPERRRRLWEPFTPVKHALARTTLNPQQPSSSRPKVKTQGRGAGWTCLSPEPTEKSFPAAVPSAV